MNEKKQGSGWLMIYVRKLQTLTCFMELVYARPWPRRCHNKQAVISEKRRGGSEMHVWYKRHFNFFGDKDSPPPHQP